MMAKYPLSFFCNKGYKFLYENGVAKYRYLYAHSYAEVKAKRLEELAQPKLVRASGVKCIARFKELSMMWLVDVKPTVKESSYTRYYPDDWYSGELGNKPHYGHLSR